MDTKERDMAKYIVVVDYLASAQVEVEIEAVDEEAAIKQAKAEVDTNPNVTWTDLEYVDAWIA